MVSKSNSIVVGLTGQFGAGCTEVVGGYLKEEGFHYYSLSDIVRASAQKKPSLFEYKKLSKKDQRKILQDEGDKLRQAGSGAIAREIYKQIKANGHENEDIVIDSIRNPAEVEYLNAAFQRRFFLLALDVSSEARWLRKQSDYEGDRKQFDQDDLRDKGDDEPPFGQHTEVCVYLADVVINNENQIGYRQEWNYFFYNIKQYIELMRDPEYRQPTDLELYMHLAYAVSLKSSCNKRQVGAIIVSEGMPERYVLAAGCNNVPSGAPICTELGGRSNPRFCAKDSYELQTLKTMKYCPRCGTELNVTSVEVVPYRCPKCNARLPRDFTPGKLLDLCRAVHAEEAAILQAAILGSSSLNGATLYTTTFPCLLCCKSIINAGIKKIFYREPYPMDESVKMLQNGVVTLEKYEGVNAWAFDKMFKVTAY